MKKKLLSVLLVVCMLLTMLPTMASAADTEMTLEQFNTAVTAALSGDGVVKLTGNITTDQRVLTVNDEDDITLDLAGFSISSSYDPYTIDVKTGGTLTIINSSETESTITNTSNGSTTIRNYGELTIGEEGETNNITVTRYNANTNGAGNSAVKNEEASTLTIYGGTFDNEDEDGVVRSIQNFGTLVIDDGTFKESVEAWTWKDVSADKTYPSTVTIEGGTFEGFVGPAADSSASTGNNTATIALNGGEFNGSVGIKGTGNYEGTFTLDDAKVTLGTDATVAVPGYTKEAGKTLTAVVGGTIETITTGGEVSGDTLTFDALVIVKSNSASGEGDTGATDQAGYWFGFKVTAPEGYTNEGANNGAKYQFQNPRVDPNNERYPFDDDPNKEGYGTKDFNTIAGTDKTYVELWAQFDLEGKMPENYKDVGNMLWYYRFDWNGDGAYDQKFTISVNPENVKLVDSAAELPVVTFVDDETDAELGKATVGSDGKVTFPTQDEDYDYLWYIAPAVEGEAAREVTKDSTFTESVTVRVKKWELHTLTLVDDTTTTESKVGERGDYNVLLNALSKSGYTFGGWEHENGTVYDGGTTYTLTADTTFTAVWTENVVTPTTPTTPTSYTVTVAATENGTVKTDVDTALRDETVTVTVTPNAGYALETLVVTDRNGSEISLTKNDDGTYTFTMPRGNVTVTATFVSTTPTTDPTPSTGDDFYDVADDAWYADAVAFVRRNGIMNGYPDNTFRPGDPFTRAALAQVLYNLEGAPTITATESTFTDVESDDWFFGAVVWAAENGVVNGYPDGSYKPFDTVSRQEMVAMICRYAVAKGLPINAVQPGDLTKFTDADTVADWALTEVSLAVGVGMLNGYTDGTLRPAADVLRQEAAQMFLNIGKLLGLE